MPLCLPLAAATQRDVRRSSVKHLVRGVKWRGYHRERKDGVALRQVFARTKRASQDAMRWTTL